MNLENNTYYILASAQLFPFMSADIPVDNKNEPLRFAIESYQAVQAENYTQAIEIYCKAITMYPEQPFFYACRSIIHRFNGDDESAFYDYQIAKRLDFNYHHFIEWLENQGEMLESDDLLELHNSTPYQLDEPQTLINRAMLQVQHFNYAEAINDYSTAFESSKDQTILISRAAIYTHVLKYDKALADLDLVLSGQQSFDAFLYRAKLYIAVKEFNAALQDLESAIALDDTKTTAYEERAQLYEQLEQFDKAITDYSMLIDMNAKDFYPYVLRADVFEKTENWNSAIADYTEAIRLNPYYSDLYQYRGALLAKIGDTSGAESDYATFQRLEEED